MKCNVILVLAAAARGALAIVVGSRDETRTCPGGLKQLRTVALPHIQFNASSDDPNKPMDEAHGKTDKYVLKFRVVEVPPNKKPNLGLGPKLLKGYRYLLFDEDRKWGLVGQGCVVEGKVVCKHTGQAAADANATVEKKACGSPCQQDVHWPQMQHVRGVLGATGTALAVTKGKDFKQGSAAMIGVGAGTMTEWLLTAYGQMTVDAVDVEGSVITAAFDCFGLGSAPGSKARLNTHVEDGVGFMKSQAQGRYDVVVMDVTPLPKHFVDSVKLIHERMAPGGVLALNGWAPDPNWVTFVQDLANQFPAVWKTKSGYGNELVFTAKSKSPNGESPFPNNFPTDLTGVPPESAKFFREFHWTKVQATK